MLRKKIIIDFAILATINDVVFYLVGLQVTQNPVWFMPILDISTPEARARLFLSVILKNGVVFVFMILRAFYKALDIPNIQNFNYDKEKTNG